MTDGFRAAITWLGSHTDPRPEESLHVAAVLMCGESHGSDLYGACAREAARSLVVLALGDERDALRDILTPDPQSAHVSYTVACYATGDIAPSHLRDFSDPVTAVCALVHCDEQTHETAELLASSRAGVRWSALGRRGRDIVFQLPSPQTINGTPRAENALGAARRRWRARLASWALAQGAVSGDDAASPAPPAPGDLAALSARVASLEETVERLALQVRDTAVQQHGADAFAQLLDEADDAFWSTDLLPHEGAR